MDLLIAIALLIICYFTGRSREKKHYKSIREREVKLYKQPHINFSQNVNISQPVKNAFSHAHSLFVEGGADNVRYGIDASYNQNKGVMKESGTRQRPSRSNS